MPWGISLRLPGDDPEAIERGFWFDPDAGERVATFFRRFLRHSKGRFAGQPFELLPWQRDLVDRLYGWKRPDGTRRYRESSVWVPKKNGKSTLIAGLELYHLVADGEPGAEVYTGARDRKQSSIIYRECESMVRASPELATRLKLVPSTKRIVFTDANAFLEALSADVGSKEGLNPSYSCIDELHVQHDRRLYDTLRYGGTARTQPLLQTISTAGDEVESIGREIWDHSHAVIDGTISDPAFLPIVYAASPDDDFEDPSVWRKANPSMGFTMDETRFGEELTAAKRSPSDWSSFLRYRLNLWLGSTDRYLDLAAWNACGAPFDPAELDGLPCWCGLDLATTTDLAAFAALYPGGRATWHFWLPKDGIEEASRRDRVDYREWARQGFVTPTPGRVIDYSFIRAAILTHNDRCPITQLGTDPYNARQLCTQLREQDGLNVVEVRQGYLSLSGPTKELGRMTMANEIRHGSNPVANWQADNACVESDPAGNIKLSKRASRRRIDGLAALVNAIACRIAGEGEPVVYEDRGLLIL